jgi:two-component system, NarL family, nitrate/nitrite response regulator NarL
VHILIADDHALFRDTLDHYIQRAQPSYRTRVVANLGDAVEHLRNVGRVDLCILDYRMPGVSGYETFRELQAAFPQTAFAVMSGIAEEEEIERVLSTGVSGYLPKTLPGRALLKAIDVMAQGGKFVPNDGGSARLMPTYIGNAPRPQPRLRPAIHLTGRERDVLRYLVEGRSNKDIAAQLNLKTVTIKLHLRGVFSKLGCSNRTQAVIKARELALLD